MIFQIHFSRYFLIRSVNFSFTMSWLRTISSVFGCFGFLRIILIAQVIIKFSPEHCFEHRPEYILECTLHIFYKSAFVFFKNCLWYFSAAGFRFIFVFVFVISFISFSSLEYHINKKSVQVSRAVRSQLTYTDKFTLSLY